MKLYDLLHYIGPNTKIFVEDERRKVLYAFYMDGEIKKLIDLDQRYVKHISVGMFPGKNPQSPEVVLVIVLNDDNNEEIIKEEEKDDKSEI